MQWMSVLFGLAGIGVLAYNVYVLKKVPEQLKSGKTRLTGKLIAMGSPDIDKNEHAFTYWFTTGWNVVRSLFGILVGLILIAFFVADLLGLFGNV